MFLKTMLCGKGLMSQYEWGVLHGGMSGCHIVLGGKSVNRRPVSFFVAKGGGHSLLQYYFVGEAVD